MKQIGILAATTILATSGFVSAADPILEWAFDGESQAGAWVGKFGTPVDGPRPPKYPAFEALNRAMSFAGHEGAIDVKDHERGGFVNVRFGKGDTFGFETWVKLGSLGQGHVAYVVGKGRHISHGENFPETNQNYAVRFQETGGGAQLGFLFTSQHPETGKFAWHRWWSAATVPPTGWHHVALQYTFGEAESLRAWIDGKPVTGKWDLDGKTDLPPVQDADDLVIGTGYTRGEGSSFRGWLDNLAIYRCGFDSEVIARRYQYVPPPPAVTREMIPPGKVLVQISEKGVPEANGWPDEPQVTETYTEDVFGFFEVPHKYVSTGVRADRQNPSHLRASAIVKLPKGKHRLLLRGRGMSRLIVDGKELLENGPRTLDSGGHTPLAVQDDYLDLGPDFRFVPPGNRDAWREFESSGGEHFVILETMLGNIKGKLKQRPELGETVAAISLEGSESWSLLSPGKRQVAYNDAGWADFAAERRAWLHGINAASRAKCREAHSEYWNRRRAAAAAWLADTKPVAVPALANGFPTNNEIDHFIAARIAAVAHDAKQGQQSEVDYFGDIRPLLENRCYDCHQGGKAQGDLRLDDHASVLRGGEAEGPAVVPGNADESALVARVTSDDDDIRMPPKGDPLSGNEIALLKRWIHGGAVWPQFDVRDFEPTPLADDLVFLRRATLDTVGV
ncbi:MAG: hypothetical protein KDA42_00120, partial [Planctomycetales bacterium]|nr:hypothetical protein [Planctomycetales bacterium]